MYNQDLVEYLGVKPRGRNEPLLAEHYNLALATQKIFEEILFEWCRKIHGKFGVDNLCLGGGSFMNSVFNGKIAESGIFGNVYIPFAPNDAGGAIGAAYHLYFDVLRNKRNGGTGVASPYLGPSYDDEQVEKALRLYKCKYRKEENIGRVAARLISDGMVVGWFQGAMEFGERALGNRSILADPRNPDSKTKVNAVIKFREQFRPFAPSVLEEHAHEFFVLPRNGFRTPYMEKVFPIRKEKAPLIPSVTHADGTGRLQTVSRAANPKYYDMIREFHSITGIPIVVNTSLNRNGEPIVCSPEDALAVFYGSGLDYMVLHDYLVEK
jgi:carbamoyltransferase